MTELVILAAGRGTRMCSKRPKVLHTLAGKALLQHVIDTTEALEANKHIVVVGHGAEAVQKGVSGKHLHFVTQAEQLGTGHAVAQALPAISKHEKVLILYGDVPLIDAATLTQLLDQVSDRSMALLTFDMQDPSGYGRIVRDDEQRVSAIVEEKDATDEQRAITEINTGVMAAMGQHLHEWLPRLSNNNAQGEYYLTDIIAMSVAGRIEVNTVQPVSELDISGINNRRQQAQLERAYQLRQAEALLDGGLSLLDPSRFDLRGSLQHGQDCELDINCVIEGQVSLGDNVKIGPHCTIKNTKIGSNVEIKANSVIEDAEIANRCIIGPFARLRPGTRLAENAKIGNFVETKNAQIGAQSKVNHLSYIGDSELGEEVNIGAGTITCNYDGVNKSKTVIEDRAFIGSNSALVAPVTIGKGSTVGAGSTVTKSSGEAQLVLSRAKQRNLDGWVRPTAKPKKQP